MVKNLKYFTLLLLLSFLFAAFTLLKKGSGSSVRIIVIDPGHGGKDPGCSGAIHNEKEVSLAVALRLGKLIEENLKDVKVIYTRTTDVFVELEDRAQIANKAKADLFISIHCNAAGQAILIKDPKTGKKRLKTYKNKKGKIVAMEKPNPIPFGTETYVMGLKNEEGKMKVATRENSAIFYEEDYEKRYGGFDPESEESYIIMSNYTTAYVIQSASLAVKIQDEYTKKAGRIDKGVHRQSIWVLWRTSMPSILTELGYLTNPLEETFLASEKGQDYLAKSIFRGLRRYKDEIEGKKKEYNDDFENQEPLENENIKAGNIPGQKKAPDEDESEDLKTVLPEKEKKEPEKTTENAPTSKKESVNDGAFAQIELGAKDTAQLNAEKEDTVLTAQDIAKKFKREQEKKSEIKAPEKEKTPIVPPENKHSQEEEHLPKEIRSRDTLTIVFKVQFASSEIPLNLKQDKYASIVEGTFYKMNRIFKYTSGNFTQIREAVRHQTQLREKGFTDCFVIALKNGIRMDIKEARAILGQ